MILQIDKRLPADVQQYGCHFMSQLFLINRCTNVELGAAIISAAYEALRKMRATYQPTPGEIMTVIGPQCEMNNPDDVVTYFGASFLTGCRMESTAYQCKAGEQELLEWQRPGWTHWVAGDGNGNVAYDPEGYSVTVREGKMVGKKIFTMEVTT